MSQFMPYTVADSFSGPGGLSVGFAMAGFRPVIAIEADEATAGTYAANHPRTEVLRRDIRTVAAEELRQLVDRLTGRPEIDVVVGGPPCQLNSYGGPSRGVYDPERLFLYRQQLRIAASLSAKVILIENVPGILTKRVRADSNRLLLEELRSDLDAIGFSYRQEYTLNTWHYGVPQNRWRWWCLASRLPEFQPHPPMFTPCRPTVGDAFANLPECAGVCEYTTGRNDYADLMRAGVDRLTLHECPPSTAALAERYSLVPPGLRIYDVWRRTEPGVRAILRDKGVFCRRPPYKQSAARLARHLPSRTVTSHVDVHLLHPTEDRIVTAREAARLQSFPDSYVFRGRINSSFNDRCRSIYEQIGSAVSPLMAYAWGLVIRRLLDTALARSAG